MIFALEDNNWIALQIDSPQIFFKMNKTKTNKLKMNQVSSLGNILLQEVFRRADGHCVEPLALQA